MPLPYFLNIHFNIILHLRCARSIQFIPLPNFLKIHFNIIPHLRCARSIQFMPLPYFLNIHFNIILHLRCARSIQFMRLPYFWKIHFNIILYLRKVFRALSLTPFVSLTKSLCAPLLSPLRATCCAHLINPNLITRIKVGRDSSVGTATRYGLEGPQIESRRWRDFPHLSRPALGSTQHPVQWVPCLSRG